MAVTSADLTAYLRGEARHSRGPADSSSRRDVTGTNRSEGVGDVAFPAYRYRQGDPSVAEGSGVSSGRSAGREPNHAHLHSASVAKIRSPHSGARVVRIGAGHRDTWRKCSQFSESLPEALGRGDATGAGGQGPTPTGRRTRSQLPIQVAGAQQAEEAASGPRVVRASHGRGRRNRSPHRRPQRCRPLKGSRRAPKGSSRSTNSLSSSGESRHRPRVVRDKSDAW
jgi:hypothetical protein